MADIVSRVRKLIELSKSNNSPEEAASAAALAADLMFKHQIGEGDLSVEEAPRAPEEIVEESVGKDKRKCVWKSSLASAIAMGFGCKMFHRSGWLQGGTSYQIFGTKSAVQTVSYMFGYLSLEITRLTEEAFHAYKASGGYEHGRTWKNSFALGCVTTLRQRLQEQRQEQAAHVEVVKASGTVSTALALYQTDQQRVEDDYKAFAKRQGMRATRASTARHSYGAFERGKSAGRGIALGGGRAGIEGSKERLEA